MKKSMFVLILAAMVMLTIGVASAQSDLPGSGWWSGEQVQNVDTNRQMITITAYHKTDFTQDFTESVELDPNSAYTFTPLNAFDGMGPGFEGSAVVRAGGQINAIVNVTNQPVQDLGVTGGKAAAQYQGTAGDVAAARLYFPLAKGDHFGKTSTFFVQNAGAGEITGASATFTMRNGDVHNYNLPTIPESRMVVFSVFDTSTYSTNVANNGKVGSLVVNSNDDTKPLAGVVMEHDTSANPAIVLNSTRGFSEADFTSKAYAPVVKNERFGRFTGIQVQNVSGGAIDITVEYQGTAGSCSGNSYTDTANGVQDGTAATFVQLPANSNLPSNCTASATISATSTEVANPYFVAIVNEQEVSGRPKAGITYFALSDLAKTTKVSIPLFKDRRFGATTGLQIQNVGSGPAVNWTATFNCTSSAGSFVATSDSAKTGSIPVGGSFLFYTPADDDLFTTANPFVSDGANCAVSVEADQEIVAVANESPVISGALDDNNYEGFNILPTP